MQSSMYSFYISSQENVAGVYSSWYQKIAKYSSGGSDFNKLPGNVLHLKDLVLMISMHKFCMFFFCSLQKGVIFCVF